MYVQIRSHVINVSLPLSAMICRIMYAQCNFWFAEKWQGVTDIRCAFVVQNQIQVEPGPGECCNCIPAYIGE